MESNTIIHIEIPAPDIGKAISFYSILCNWKIDITPPGNYAFFLIGDMQTGDGFDAG